MPLCSCSCAFLGGNLYFMLWKLLTLKLPNETQAERRQAESKRLEALEEGGQSESLFF